MENFLILAAGTRNKIVQYFKKTFAGVGKVIATDANALGPAIYDADKYYLVPPITEPGYIDKILDICKKEEITGVLSLIAIMSVSAASVSQPYDRTMSRISGIAAYAPPKEKQPTFRNPASRFHQIMTPHRLSRTASAEKETRPG